MDGEKILVIDDNKEFSSELKETLYLCGYECAVICDSLKALKTARKIKPNVILLDLRMSGANGFQTAKELKNNRETSDIPIIAMSGYFPIEDRSKLLDMSNMDSRIKKPFGITDLINEIEAVLK